MIILYTTFIDNILTDVYMWDEYESNILCLLLSSFFIIWSLPISYMMDYYGYYIQYNILSVFLFFLSFLFLFFGANESSIFGGYGNKSYSIIALCIFAIGQLFISTIFTLKVLISKPIELAPYIACIITVFHWFFTFIFSNIIDYLSVNDVSNTITKPIQTSYLDSILFILFITFLQFAISAMIYAISIKKNLNLHHPTPNTKGLINNKSTNNKLKQELKPTFFINDFNDFNDRDYYQTMDKDQEINDIW